MTAREIVRMHLRAVEAGDWEKALSFIAPHYRLSGVVPFPVSLFVRIGRDEALRMHQARKRALPDFRFNETFTSEAPARVTIQVGITGTHDGLIDYRGILRGVPVLEPTGKKVRLNPEWFTYTVANDLIVETVARIPKDAGVKGLVRAIRG